MPAATAIFRRRTRRQGQPRPWLVLALALPLTSPLRAQSPRDGGLATPAAIRQDASAFARRIGLWASAGLGRGSAGLQCEACQGTTTAALTAQVAVGGRPHNRFHAGVERWTRLDVIGDGVDRTARGLQVVARHDPSDGRRWFVTGAAGSSRFRVDDGNTRFVASSPALTLGLGIDLRARGTVLTPAVSITSSTGGPLRSERTGNTVAENARLGMWRGTLSVTWF